MKMPGEVIASVVSKTQLPEDRKSTRLNSSHSQISYAVFCLKKNSRRRRARTDPPVPRKPRAVLRHRGIDHRRAAGANASSGAEGRRRSARRVDRVDDLLRLF